MTRREMLQALISASLAAVAAAAGRLGFAAEEGNFRAIYLDPRLRERFFLFLQNVFHLYPEEKLHALIARTAEANPTDREIYEAILAEIPSVRPPLRDLRYALPALHKQKQVLADQTLILLEDHRAFRRYAEIGSTGRYYDRLADVLSFAEPPAFIHTAKPSYQPQEILERGRLRKVGEYFPLGPYDALALPEGSVDLLTVYIGFHHAPLERRVAFIRSCHRTLSQGGILIVRDHDVTDDSMEHLVALAHDVFNCGLQLPWEANAAEVRHFMSLQELRGILESTGFRPRAERLLQVGDPTRNTLMRFDKA